MIYKDLPLNHYFKFKNNTFNRTRPWCKMTAQKIREFGVPDNTDYILWRKPNEEVVDMGSFDNVVKDLQFMFN